RERGGGRRGLQRRRRAAGVARRPRGAAVRARRGRLVAPRPLPGRAGDDRHRRLLRGRLQAPRAARVGPACRAARGDRALPCLLPRARGVVLVVPYLDLGRNVAALRAELEDAFAAVVSRGRFVNGPALERFEERWSDWCRVPHAIGVNSGTDAIALALRALAVGPGDEVITPANTCVATVTGIAATGATAVLADVDPRTWTLDAASARAAVTGRTRAIVPVHLYGQCADLGALREFGLPIVEDAAQAHGAEYRGERRGELAAYSFYPTKNLGALGDAGAVVTSDEELAERLRMLRSHGERAEARGVAVVAGSNSRLDELQAEILLRKLERLDGWNERRRRL